LLHFQGYEDGRPAERRRMKAAENRLVHDLSRRFSLSDLSQRLKVRT
jgi:hypothetical protein